MVIKIREELEMNVKETDYFCICHQYWLKLVNSREVLAWNCALWYQ